MHDFLSHLCGDEEADYDIDNYSKFLSHLCGDEVDLFPSKPDSLFLSHLCGDEDGCDYLQRR